MTPLRAGPFIASLPGRAFAGHNEEVNRVFPVPLLIFAVTLAPGGLVSGQDTELPVFRRCFAEVKEAVPPFVNGRFDPRQGETISFLGGSDTFDFDRYLFLESAFHLSWPGQELHLRNLACQGDTIFYQARPLYFYTKKGDTQPGSLPDHRERTIPGIIFLCFGKMESLDGSASLPQFLAAYKKVLDELTPLTNRLVLMSPTPFFPTGPAAAQVKMRNPVLGEFVAGMRGLAGERGMLFVDLFTPLLSDLDAAWSLNGIHLTEAGHRVVAAQIAEQLKFPGGPVNVASQSLRQAIERKNRLWQQYYRPTNWAFLFGDRQHVPASRDPVDRDQRWFVREIDSLPGLIAETEADIHRYAREAAHQ